MSAMMLSVEISKYPLRDEYIEPIQAFIDRLKAEPEIEVVGNTMSTQVFGDYDTVMAVLNREMKASFERFGKVIFVCKFVNADLRPEAAG